MKKNIFRIVSILLCCVLISSATCSLAVTRASDYFSRTEVKVTPLGDGKIAVEFDIVATDTMKELGARQITIYEQQSSGSYKAVRTFSRYSTAGMIFTDCDGCYNYLEYQGKSGVNYYATVDLYAKDNQGSETLYTSTKVAKA